MKDIRSYIIGFLSAICLFLFLGLTEDNEDGYFDKIYANEIIMSDEKADLSIQASTISMDSEESSAIFESDGISVISDNYMFLLLPSGFAGFDNTFADEEKQLRFSMGVNDINGSYLDLFNINGIPTITLSNHEKSQYGIVALYDSQGNFKNMLKGE